jgi:S1-C subfamily serine protease
MRFPRRVTHGVPGGNGVIVVSVTPGGAAANAGMRAGNGTRTTLRVTLGTYPGS